MPAAAPDRDATYPHTMCWLCWAPTSLGDGASGPARTLRADAPEPTAPRLHLILTGHAGVDGLMSGFAWADNDPVSFAFTDSASDYEAFYGASEPARGFAPVGAGMREAVRRILLGEASGAAGGPGSPGPSVLGFTNLAIVEASQDFSADIRIARSSAPSTAWAYYPNGREGGDVWFGSRHNFDTPRLGTYQFMVAVHELGHALGLKHPHDSSNGFAPMPIEWDSLEFTVMSYRSRIGAATNTGYTNGAFDYPQGWMMLDIAALQALYGADYTLRAGDTRYGWSADTGETFIDGIGQGRPGEGTVGDTNRIFLTIWDGGGVDTFDLSNYANGVAVDLSPGGHSVLSVVQLATLDVRDGTTARGNIFNALLHQDDTRSLIENAIGGAGRDTLIGNEAANRLEGGAGDDLLEGRDGADLLIGGAGADTLVGGSGDDTYLVTDALDRIIETGRGDIDTLLVETALAIALPEGVEILRLGEAGRTGIGNAGPNQMFGNRHANRLEGREGSDVIQGGGGADTLLGGTGADLFVLRKGDGFDHILDFAPGEDRLVLTGFGLDAAAVLARAAAVQAGVVLDLGGGDGLLLAALTPPRLTLADFVLAG